MLNRARGRSMFSIARGHSSRRRRRGTDMRESILQVQLIHEKSPRPRRVRSLFDRVYLGSLIDVENNRRSGRDAAQWMRCRVHRLLGEQMWVIPVTR